MQISPACQNDSQIDTHRRLTCRSMLEATECSTFPCQPDYLWLIAAWIGIREFLFVQIHLVDTVLSPIRQNRLPAMTLDLDW